MLIVGALGGGAGGRSGAHGAETQRVESNRGEQRSECQDTRRSDLHLEGTPSSTLRAQQQTPQSSDAR